MRAKVSSEAVSDWDSESSLALLDAARDGDVDAGGVGRGAVDGGE